MKRKTLFMLHKWTAVVVGAQFLIWSITGLYFSLTGHEWLNAEQNRMHPNNTAVLSAPEWYPDHEEIESATLQRVANQLVWNIVTTTGSNWLSAETGDTWTANAQVARVIAEQSYHGALSATDVHFYPNGIDVLINEELSDLGDGVYEVIFDDTLETTVYVAEKNGEVITHRNKWSTLNDWAFRLHFMDYNGGKNFNNPLTWTFSAAFLWFITTGIWLLLVSIRFKRK
ncbi:MULTISPECIES: PepSY domain-containing protein [Gammaproteobacteria]|uniref:PepSY domain-containing protein n=1 Tax=Gammaproteobacteria TaxID=1236 RepID=UPI000DCF6704|nr:MULTISPECIES: PepSY domain-containing protein [Gammaproteobacteria]RTE86409.1 hypothetical protein DQX04_07560 [Aliidiomarina sp. B3213]TCZ91757.1 hypothetical protein EYQ95_07565 [Lysobacter sp. N42]